jgi:hypothetical protein
MIWKETRRTKATKAWIENTDPIRLSTYYILLYVKYLVIALVVYIFVLTISDILFTIENTSDIAKGGYYWEKQNPKLKI